ncbi:MAG: dihydropteroate synthase [Sphingomonadales bacterium CG12_big_fil_rev_8_21_14_0_65_65_10]|nr:MAG: dihydropteroate synthase [Sphingomonadales bacterium CG12_big_fil_rev_8_21_14_0_65_65_10]
MSNSVYIRPIALAGSPQSEEGEAIRLAGGMVYASRFAVIVREGDKVVSRVRCGVAEMPEVLGALPDELGDEGEAQWANLTLAHPPLELGARTVRMDQPQVVGILNVTPDSFSDGGAFMDDPEAMREQAAAMCEGGAAMIDIGGESTRPSAKEVWEGDEIARVVPAIEAVSAMGAAISIDTRKVGVMEAALQAGAHVVNDVSALRHDPRSLAFVADRGVPVILMHAPGDGPNPHEGGDYANVVLDVFDALKERRDVALEAGIAARNILLDPGIGFGKTLAENLALINALPLFHALGHPLMLGASRKRMIGALSNEAPAHERLGGSIALAVKGMEAGYQLLRVHDVTETVQARNVWRGLRDAALTDFGELPT